MTILNCIEQLAESCSDEGIGPVVVSIRVDSAAQVDALYAALGRPVGGRYEEPHVDEFGIRRAMTEVAGSAVMIVQSQVSAMTRRAA